MRFSRTGRGFESIAALRCNNCMVVYHDIEARHQGAGTLREFYDVSVLAGVSRPSITNMQQAITKDIHLPPPAATFRAPSARPGRGSMDDLYITTRIED